MKLLLDSDFLFALFAAHDPNHSKAIYLLDTYKKQKAQFFVTNLVFQEAATVVSYKIGQREALEFLNRFDEVGAVQLTVDTKVEGKAWEIFKQQTKKGTSFIDCANVASADYYKLDGILSFDRFYEDKLVSS